jgi:hypothetical protein
MIIRFNYSQSSDDAVQISAMLRTTDRSSYEGLRMTAMLKVTDGSINENNIVDYLNERYPERKNIEIAKIISS